MNASKSTDINAENGRISAKDAFRLTFQTYARFKGLIIFGVFFMAVFKYYSLVELWFLKFFIDSVLDENPLPALLTKLIPAPWIETRYKLLLLVIFGYIIYFITLNLIGIISQFLDRKLEFEVINEQRSKLFERLQLLPIGFHQQTKMGDSVYRFTQDIYGIPIIWKTGVVDPLMNLIYLSGIAVVILMKAPAILLVTLGLVPFMVFTAKSFEPKIRREREQARTMDAGLMDLIHQTITNIKTVKVFARETFEITRFGNECRRLINQWLKIFYIESGFGFLLQLVSVASTLVIFYIGALRVFEGKLHIGDVVMIKGYIDLIRGPIQQLVRVKVDIQQGMVGVEKVHQVMKETTEALHSIEGQELPDVKEGLEFRDVSFGYGLNQAVLRHVNFNAKIGDVVALVGGSGEGKSTIINLVMRLYEPTLGKVLLDGRDITQHSVKSVRDKMSVVMQEVPLFPGTIKQNILYSNPNATMSDVERAAVKANAHNFILKFPRQYETFIGGEDGVQLSMGQRQRIAIARAFLRDTPILILDEPTSALDSKAESAIIESLDRLIKGRLVLVIAHRLSTIRYADKILVIKNGQIVEQGTHNQLMALKGEYFSFNTTQHMSLAEAD